MDLERSSRKRVCGLIGVVGRPKELEDVRNCC